MNSLSSKLEGLLPMSTIILRYARQFPCTPGFVRKLTMSIKTKNARAKRIGHPRIVAQTTQEKRDVQPYTKWHFQNLVVHEVVFCTGLV